MTNAVAPAALPAMVLAREAAHPGASLAAWIDEHREALHERLAHEGAMLFREFGVESAEQFHGCCAAFETQLADYAGGGTPRTAVTGHVYTSTEYPPQEAIPLHIEASYLRRIPRFVFFFCEVPPAAAGQTPLGDMRRVLEQLDEGVRQRFASSGIRYINNMHGGAGYGKSWQQTFMTGDRMQVEARLLDDGYEFEWKDDGGLRTALTAPATARHPDTGIEFWCNQAINWHASQFDRVTRRAVERAYGDVNNFPKHATFGDGAPISDEDCTHVRDILRREEQVFTWQRGDVLFCDNAAIAHGRQPFEGRRRILVAMA